MVYGACPLYGRGRETHLWARSGGARRHSWHTPLAASGYLLEETNPSLYIFTGQQSPCLYFLAHSPTIYCIVTKYYFAYKRRWTCPCTISNNISSCATMFSLPLSVISLKVSDPQARRSISPAWPPVVFHPGLQHTYPMSPTSSATPAFFQFPRTATTFYGGALWARGQPFISAGCPALSLHYPWHSPRAPAPPQHLYLNSHLGGFSVFYVCAYSTFVHSPRETFGVFL